MGTPAHRWYGTILGRFFDPCHPTLPPASHQHKKNRIKNKKSRFFDPCHRTLPPASHKNSQQTVA
jgi:hypothetical protein